MARETAGREVTVEREQTVWQRTVGADGRSRRTEKTELTVLTAEERG